MQRSRLRLWAGRNSGTGSGAMRRFFGRVQALSCAASCAALLLSAGAGFVAGIPGPARAESGAPPPRLVALESGQPDPATDPRVAAFDHFLSQQVAAGEFVGIAVAIVDRGQLSLVKGYGRRSQTEGGRVDDQTVFRVASLSKAFASTLTGLMVKEHFVDWSTPVRQVLPRMSLGASRNNVTVGDLLSHRVGLPPNAYDDLLEAGVPTGEIVSRLSGLSLSCPPGSCYGYQNVAFNLVAPVLEARTGASYPELVRERLFTPLFMRRASLGLEGLQQDDNWARPHVRIGERRWREVTVKPAYYEVPAAAGVNASARDMAKWLMAQLGMAPHAVPKDVLETIHKPRVNTPRELYRARPRYEGVRTARYGYGWRYYNINGVEVVWHSGVVQGYIAQIAFVPEQKSGIVFLTNGYSKTFPSLLPAYLETFIDGIKTRGLVLEGFPSRTQMAAGDAAPPAAGGE